MKKNKRSKRRNPVDPVLLAKAIAAMAVAAQTSKPKSTRLADKTKRFIQYVQDVVASVRQTPAPAPVDHLANETLRQLTVAREDLTLLGTAIQRYTTAKANVEDVPFLRKHRKGTIAKQLEREYTLASQVLDNVLHLTKLR